MIVALIAWFWTQSLLGKRPLPPQGIGDRIHVWTAGLNVYLGEHMQATNSLLILSSLFIDSLGIFLLGWGIVGNSFRPVLGLVLIFVLRQICQSLTALPPPQNALWQGPGFPSLLVTYGVSTDLFFSGHTAIDIYGATELARLNKSLLTWAGIGIALFEIITVLILRAHYMLDVFTGAVVALLVACVIEKWSAPIDRWFFEMNKNQETRS